MSSGLYSVLSGAAARMKQMDTISDNLSNANTVGFKKGQAVFEGLLEGVASETERRGIDFAFIREGFSDFEQGALNNTGVSLHLGINGEGFFKVRDDAANEFYTRKGTMQMDRDGNLVTSSGLMLLDDKSNPIKLDNSDPLIDETGHIQRGDGRTIKIPLYTFADSAQLQRHSGGLFSLTGGEEKLVERPMVLQGQIEASNVNLMQEMGRMIEAMRVFEACQKMMKNHDNLAEKANRLGAL